MNRLILNCIFLLNVSVLSAQTAVPASGGNGSGTGGTVSYTIGQVGYSTNTALSGSVSHGAQQPYEISVVTASEEAEDISLTFSVYPNPSSDYIRLKIENHETGNLIYQLFDMRGILLEEKKIESNETTILMQNYFQGIYFLKVVKADKSVTEKLMKTFKVIKK